MDEPHRKTGAFVWPIVVLLMLLFAYPLSLGPIHWLESRGYYSQATAEIVGRVFAPLGWAFEQCPPVYSAMIWYVNMWRASPVLAPYRAPSPGTTTPMSAGPPASAE